MGWERARKRAQKVLHSHTPVTLIEGQGNLNLYRFRWCLHSNVKRNRSAKIRTLVNVKRNGVCLLCLGVLFVCLLAFVTFLCVCVCFVCFLSPVLVCCLYVYLLYCFCVIFLCFVPNDINEEEPSLKYRSNKVYIQYIMKFIAPTSLNSLPNFIQIQWVLCGTIGAEAVAFLHSCDLESTYERIKSRL